MSSTTSVCFTALAITVSAFLLAGCQSTGPRSDEREVPAPTEASTDTPTRATEPSEAPTATEAAQSSYTDPSKADTYCTAIEDLVTLNKEASKEDESTTVTELGTRLDLLVSGTKHISELAPNDDAEHAWQAMSDDYQKAADLYKSSGNQVSNTDFLLLLSEATTTANTTYRHQSEQVEQNCGVDITQLIGEEK